MYSGKSTVLFLAPFTSLALSLPIFHVIFSQAR
jgi:hypothetical protein